jgi:transcriptional regulator with XRE-family HTH domain
MSVTEKSCLIDTYDSLSQTEVAAKLGVPQSTLSKLLKSRDKSNTNTTSENRKRKHEGKCHSVDEALLVWFRQGSSYNAPINHSILLQKKKANDFGGKLEKDFKATDGWLTDGRRHMALFIKNFMEENTTLMARQLSTGYKLIRKLY